MTIETNAAGSPLSNRTTVLNPACRSGERSIGTSPTLGRPENRLSGEPAQVHVERDDSMAKGWLDPVRLERGGGFPAAELREVVRLVDRNKETLIEAWNEFGR